MIQDMLMEQKGINELIDTLWNVNDTQGWETADEYLELIDTLWNVNYFYSPFFVSITLN